MVTFEPSIKVGDLITLVGFLVGGLGFVYSMRGEIRMLAATVKAQGKAVEAQNEDIKDLKTIVAAQALHSQRMDFLDRQVEDLRNGVGFKIHREFTSATPTLFEPR